MNNFKTVEEKSEEWGITTRHIQHLCRGGKIAGAIKRAGAWFIPDNVQSPGKNTKSEDKLFKFVGTKKKIFDNSIKLFTQKGFENVSVNDIAEITGIRQSAVYNHFKSKQDILDTIYNFYCYYYLSNRPSFSDLETLLRTGSILDIVVKGFRYNFNGDVLMHMTDICKIIMQRVGVDQRAKEIFQKLTLEEGVKFVEEGLNKVVEYGRIAPFDTHMASVLINSVSLYTLHWWLVEPSLEIYNKILEDEQTLYKHISNFLVDLKLNDD